MRNKMKFFRNVGLGILLSVMIWPIFAQETKTVTNDISGSWLGLLDVGAMKLRLVFKISKTADGKWAALCDSPDQGAKDIPCTSVSWEKDQVTIEMKDLMASFSGQLKENSGMIDGTFKQGGQSLPLVCKRVKADDPALINIETATYHAPNYENPSMFQEREITVGRDEWKLPGTLTLPVGKGPFPVLILVHGSGPNDRDETIGPNKPFRDLASGLAAQGIAVLRYEKRTKRYAEKLRNSLVGFTVNEEVVDDAVAAVTLARQTAAIDPNKVFILGHSLGGILVPRIAAGHPEIAGFIIMAGALARPSEDLLLEQTIFQLSLSNLPAETKQKQLDEIKQVVAAIKAVSKKSPAQDLIFHAPPSYWLDLKNYNPLAAAKALKQPLLVLQGEKDCQVNIQRDFGVWQQTLAGRKNVVLKSYPDLNHLFMYVQGQSTGAEYQNPGNIAVIVINDIAKWIKSI